MEKRGELFPDFIASLPANGWDGTLKKRLADSSAVNHAHLKTGSLEGVQSIAGYVHSRSGKKWILVFLINHPHATAARAAQNALVEWVQQQ